MSAVFKTKLGTITQTNHWIESGNVIAYEPYVREMRVWADLFELVEVFTPLTQGTKKGTLCGYERQNASFRFVRYDTRVFRWGFLVRLFQLPVVFFQMAAFIWRHDFLLIRSPGHFSLMAHLLVVLFRKKSITKFAGFFGCFKGERIPSVVERFFMRHFLGKRNVVLVYGKSLRPNFISYFPLLLSEKEMEQLANLQAGRPAHDIFRFYSLGRLIKVKGYDLALRGLGELFKVSPQLKWHYHVVGDGPEQAQLSELAQSLGIADRVTFEGKQPYLQAMRMIKGGDAVIMPGVMEGWPKVIVEAWVAGVVPICASAGLIPDVIENGRNGFLFEPNPASLAAACVQFMEMGRGAQQRLVAQGRIKLSGLSADSFREGIMSICADRLQVF